MRSSGLLQFVLGASAVLWSGVSLANDAPVGHCKEYNWRPGDVIPVEASMYKHVSIKLPEESMDVIWAAKELWETEFIKNYIFVKPLTLQAQGADTTVTAVGQSGNSYEFAVRRVARPSAQCIIINTNGSMVSRANWDARDAQQATQVQALTSQIARLNADKALMESDAERRARNAVKLYRGAINTNYEWTAAEGWFAGNGGVVDSVHDDGRFTYVKLKHDNRGLMSVTAEIDGKAEILEASYDASTRTYTISGIFPRFNLKAGESALTITRKGA